MTSIKTIICELENNTYITHFAEYWIFYCLFKFQQVHLNVLFGTCPSIRHKYNSTVKYIQHVDI